VTLPVETWSRCFFPIEKSHLIPKSARFKVSGAYEKSLVRVGSGWDHSNGRARRKGKRWSWYSAGVVASTLPDSEGPAKDRGNAWENNDKILDPNFPTSWDTAVSRPHADDPGSFRYPLATAFDKKRKLNLLSTLTSPPSPEHFTNA